MENNIAFIHIIVVIVVIISITASLINQYHLAKLIGKITEIQSSNNNLAHKIAAIETMFEQYQEAKAIPESIEKPMHIYIDSKGNLDTEIKLACKRGVELAANYYKKLYLRKTFDKTNEYQRIYNILKEIKASFNFDNLEMITTKNKPHFEELLSNTLKQTIPDIVRNIERFRNEYYNGNTCEKYVGMCVGTLKMLVDKVENQFITAIKIQ